MVGLARLSGPMGFKKMETDFSFADITLFFLFQWPLWIGPD
jgi:hypothetical protein